MMILLLIGLVMSSIITTYLSIKLYKDNKKQREIDKLESEILDFQEYPYTMEDSYSEKPKPQTKRYTYENGVWIDHLLHKTYDLKNLY